MLAFGRLGRRRRQLIEKLVRPDSDIPPNSAALEELIASARATGRLGKVDAVSKENEQQRTWTKQPYDDWLAKWDTAKVDALALSQSRAALPPIPLPDLRTRDLNPEKHIPAKNIWGRPLPRKLARSKLKKAYKEIIMRLLPPVGQGEWDVLRKLASGEAGSEWAVPSRRPVAQPVGDLAEEREPKGMGEVVGWEWREYAAKPVRAVDRKKSRNLSALTGVLDDTSLRPTPAVGIHRYTDRFWRRMYSDIWRMTATMDKKEGGQGWDIKWGSLDTDVSTPTTVHAEFFDGIASSGRLSETPQS